VILAVSWYLSLSQSSSHHRVALLTDSMVVAGAVTKGRSSSPDLLRRLRSLAALQLASGLRLFLRWIPSASNPADGPSRFF
jgi:hypothetical protein